MSKLSAPFPEVPIQDTRKWNRKIADALEAVDDGDKVTQREELVLALDRGLLDPDDFASYVLWARARSQDTSMPPAARLLETRIRDEFDAIKQPSSRDITHLRILLDDAASAVPAQHPAHLVLNSMVEKLPLMLLSVSLVSDDRKPKTEASANTIALAAGQFAGRIASFCLTRNSAPGPLAMALRAAEQVTPTDVLGSDLVQSLEDELERLSHIEGWTEDKQRALGKSIGLLYALAALAPSEAERLEDVAATYEQIGSFAPNDVSRMLDGFASKIKNFRFLLSSE
jgi:hypothetical protein